MDYRSMDSEQLRKLARERKVNAVGAIGTTSWLAVAKRDAIIAALEANDCGVTLDVPAAVAATPAAANRDEVAHAIEILSGAFSRPVAVEMDENRVREIAREVANAPQRIEVSRVDSNGRAVVDVGVQHRQFARLLHLVNIGIPVLIVGPAGGGKSEAARAVAKALALDFIADSYSEDSGRHDIFGFVDAQSRYVTTGFRIAYETGALHCNDEIDNGPPALTSGFNLALSNGHCRFPDGTQVSRHAGFRFIGTCNTLHGATLAYNGRQAIDKALQDRCATLQWDIDERFERTLALAHNPDASRWVDTVQRVRKAADAAGLTRYSPTPRASIYGAQDLLAGATLADALEAFIYRGSDASTRARLEAAAA